MIKQTLTREWQELRLTQGTLRNTNTTNRVEIAYSDTVPNKEDEGILYGDYTFPIYAFEGQKVYARSFDLDSLEVVLYKGFDLRVIGGIGGGTSKDSPITYEGSVATYTALLALTDIEKGEMYNVTETGANYVFNGTSWDKLSEDIDLSMLLPKGEGLDPLITSAKDIMTEIEKKQSTLVSGTNIKTINNLSILGSGNLEIDVDTSGLLPKGEGLDPSITSAKDIMDEIEKKQSILEKKVIGSLEVVDYSLSYIAPDGYIIRDGHIFTQEEKNKYPNAKYLVGDLVPDDRGYWKDILESTSDDNGTSIKYADGTLIYTMNTAKVTGTVITYPIPFTSMSYKDTNYGGTSSDTQSSYTQVGIGDYGGIGTVSLTGFTVSTNSVDRGIQARIYGRWTEDTPPYNMTYIEYVGDNVLISPTEDLSGKLDRGDLTSKIPDAKTMLDLIQANAGLMYDPECLYIQETKTKKAGYYYLDENQIGLWRCLEDTDINYNSATYFTKESIRENASKLENLNKYKYLMKGINNEYFSGELYMHRLGNIVIYNIRGRLLASAQGGVTFAVFQEDKDFIPEQDISLVFIDSDLSFSQIDITTDGNIYLQNSKGNSATGGGSCSAVAKYKT